MVVFTPEYTGNVLVLEDEYLVSLGIVALLEDIGFTVAGPVARVAEACKLAREEDLVLAMLDVNLAGEFSWPVALILKSRRIPVIFLTGYLSSSLRLPPELSDTPVCAKPLEEKQVRSAIDALLRGR